MFNEQENNRQYDSPLSIDDEKEFFEESIPEKAKKKALQIGKKIKEHKKKLALTAIALIFVFFLADFFFFSIKQVSFNVTDTEKDSLPGAQITVFGNDSKPIQTIPSNDTISLRKGNYFYSIALNGFKPVQKKQFEVLGNEEISQTLEKNLDLEILFKNNFPEKAVAGQVFIFEVVLKNNSDKQEQAELVFEDDFAQKIMEVSYNAPLLLNAGENNAQLLFKVKNDLLESQIKDSLKGTIRIKGLNNSKSKKSFEFGLIFFDQSKLRISGTANFGTVEEGTTSLERKITIKNQNNFDIHDIDIQVQINSTQFSPKNEAPDWFSFSAPVPIQTIKSGSEESIGITVTVPTGINFDESTNQENILGRFLIKTSFFEFPLELDLVVKKSQSKLEFSGTTNKTIRSQDGAFPSTPVSVKLKNTGNLAIKNISISAQCDQGHWIFLSNDFVSQILPKTEETIVFRIQIPSNVSSQSNSICQLTATYDNPRKTEPLRVSSDSQPFTITAN